MNDHPFMILFKAAQSGAQNEDDLAQKAAAIGPPPPVGAQMAPSMPPMGPMQQMRAPKEPKGALLPPTMPKMVPPMSQGTARTRVGDHLVGGKY